MSRSLTHIARDVACLSHAHDIDGSIVNWPPDLHSAMLRDAEEACAACDVDRRGVSGRQAGNEPTSCVIADRSDGHPATCTRCPGRSSDIRDRSSKRICPAWQNATGDAASTVIRRCECYMARTALVALAFVAFCECSVASEPCLWRPGQSGRSSLCDWELRSSPIASGAIVPPSASSRATPSAVPRTEVIFRNTLAAFWVTTVSPTW